MATPGPSTSGLASTSGPSSSNGPPSEVAEEVPFHDVCGLMERVQKVSGLEKKKRILASFLEKWREEHQRLHPTDADTTVSLSLSLFPLPSHTLCRSLAK